MSAEGVIQSIMDLDSDDWSCNSEGDDSDADIAVRDRDGTNFADVSAVVDVVPTAVVALDSPEDIRDVDVELEQGAATQVTPAQDADTNADHGEIFFDAKTCVQEPDNSPAARDDAAWTTRMTNLLFLNSLHGLESQCSHQMMPQHQQDNGASVRQWSRFSVGLCRNDLSKSERLRKI